MALRGLKVGRAERGRGLDDGAGLQLATTLHPIELDHLVRDLPTQPQLRSRLAHYAATAQSSALSRTDRT